MVRHVMQVRFIEQVFSVGGTLVFLPGETTHKILVTATDDTQFEPQETFLVSLSNAIGASIVDNQGVVTTEDDDSTRTIAIGDATAAEGETSAQWIDTFASYLSGGLRGPEPVVFGPDGNLYAGNIWDNSVTVFDGISGTFIKELVPSDSGSLNEPAGLVFDASGNLHVSDPGTNQPIWCS